MDLGVDDSLWNRELFMELGLRVVDGIVKLRNDNNAAMFSAINPSVTDKMKVVVARYHHIKGALEKEEIYLDRVDSGKNKADGLTKPLPRKESMEAFRRFHHLSNAGVLEILRGDDSDWEDRAVRTKRGFEGKARS